jgi:hypothetical protein
MKDVGTTQRWKRWPLGQRIRASFEPGFTGCGKIRYTAVSLKGRGFSRAVSRLFASAALAAEGRSRADIDFFSSLFSPVGIEPPGTRAILPVPEKI